MHILCDNIAASFHLFYATGMPRHAPSRSKPFSGKQKKAQLQEKRLKKRDAGATYEETHDQDATTVLVESLGKGGEKNRWSTVFVRENDADGTVNVQRPTLCSELSVHRLQSRQGASQRTPPLTRHCGAVPSERIARTMTPLLIIPEASACQGVA